MEQLQMCFESMTEPNVTDESALKAAIANEINNPEYTQYLAVSTNKDASISIKTKGILVAKVKLTGKKKYLAIRSKNAVHFQNCIAMESCESEQSDSSMTDDEEWTRIAIESIKDVLRHAKPLSVIYMLILSEFGGESFGCCSRYIECSDAKKCIHPNQLTAMACIYKKSLESGRIFYGKNRNI